MLSFILKFFLQDLLTVSETATEPPQDEGQGINTPKNLALEATFINQNFSQQVLKTVGTWNLLKFASFLLHALVPSST